MSGVVAQDPGYELQPASLARDRRDVLEALARDVYGPRIRELVGLEPAELELVREDVDDGGIVLEWHATVGDRRATARLQLLGWALVADPALLEGELRRSMLTCGRELAVRLADASSSAGASS